MKYRDCLIKDPKVFCPDNNAISRLYFKTIIGNDSLCKSPSPTRECQEIYDWQDKSDIAELAFAGTVLFYSAYAFYHF